MTLTTKICVLSAVTLLLTACDDRISIANQKMEEIRAQPAQPIVEVPKPEIVESFDYTAGDMRSPFLPPSLLLQKQMDLTSAKPDLNRIRDPLESYDLSELTYRGRVVAHDGHEYGLVQLPDGYVKEVQIGEYIGKNEGKILEITPTQINLEEIVPDSRVGFVSKKTSLATPN